MRKFESRATYAVGDLYADRQTWRLHRVPVFEIAITQVIAELDSGWNMVREASHLFDDGAPRGGIGGLISNGLRAVPLNGELGGRDAPCQTFDFPEQRIAHALLRNGALQLADSAVHCQTRRSLSSQWRTGALPERTHLRRHRVLVGHGRVERPGVLEKL